MTDINTASLIEQMRTLVAQAEGIRPEKVSDETSFSSAFKEALGQVNSSNMKAGDLATRFELGDPNVSISEVMVETQKANLGFQATLMVRNKVVQAYTDIMNMPV
jgi:flagellar hook-basal body complex protein FliE